MSRNEDETATIPPIANRGVYPSVGGVPVPQFDWYGATVCAPHTVLLDVIEQALMDAGEDTVRCDGGKVRRYQAITFVNDRQGRKLAAVKHGGAYPFPHFEAEGAASPAVAQAVRAMDAVHKPTRLDSAVDQTRPGLFEDLHELAKELEQKYRLHLNYAGAAVDNYQRGTTIYLGSRQSSVFVRIYQKGLHLAEQQGLDPQAIPPAMLNWVRAELVFRPDKPPAKAFAAQATPADLWGVSAWTREFAMRSLSIKAERVKMNQRRESDHERALRFMASQYRSHLHRLIVDCGGDYAQAMAVLVDLASLEVTQQAA